MLIRLDVVVLSTVAAQYYRSKFYLNIPSLFTVTVP